MDHHINPKGQHEEQKLKQPMSKEGSAVVTTPGRGLPSFAASSCEWWGEMPRCHHPAQSTPSAAQAAINGAAAQATVCKLQEIGDTDGRKGGRRGALGVPCSPYVLLLWSGPLTTAAASQPAKLPGED